MIYEMHTVWISLQNYNILHTMSMEHTKKKKNKTTELLINFQWRHQWRQTASKKLKTKNEINRKSTHQSQLCFNCMPETLTQNNFFISLIDKRRHATLYWTCCTKSFSVKIKTSQLKQKRKQNSLSSLMLPKKKKKKIHGTHHKSTIKKETKNCIHSLGQSGQTYMQHPYKSTMQQQ